MKKYKSKESEYEKQLNIKIEERLTSMESADYIFAKRFNKRDYFIVLVVVVLCLAFLILGIYL